MSDVAIFPVGAVSSTAPKAVKPAYLVFLEDAGNKTKGTRKFITLDKPDLKEGFIEVKGFFTDASEEDIVAHLPESTVPTNKEDVQEVLFPWHKIGHIRSLAFRSK